MTFSDELLHMDTPVLTDHWVLQICVDTGYRLEDLSEEMDDMDVWREGDSQKDREEQGTPSCGHEFLPAEPRMSCSPYLDVF